MALLVASDWAQQHGEKGEDSKEKGQAGVVGREVVEFRPSENFPEDYRVERGLLPDRADYLPHRHPLAWVGSYKPKVVTYMCS